MNYELLGTQVHVVPGNSTYTFHLGPFLHRPDLVQVDPSTPDVVPSQGYFEWSYPMIQGRISVEGDGDHPQVEFTAVLTVRNLLPDDAPCIATALKINLA
jgi:hypothetical protein